MTLDMFGPTAALFEARPEVIELADDKCCSSCQAPKEKYYSIDHMWNQCGECCMEPKDFPKYHMFEKGLTHANATTPCLDNNYATYSKTETHGFGPIKMTLDMYKP